MDMLEKVVEYLNELEDDFANISRNLRYVDCDEIEQKKLDNITSKLDLDIYDLDILLKELQGHSEE